MPSSRQLILALVLAGVGLSAWWFQPDGIPEQGTSRPADRRPDYIVERLTVVTMGEGGRPDRRLVAEELRHFSEEGGNELEEPRLTIFRAEEPPWLVRSERGNVSDNGEEVFLQGPVFIDRAAGAETPPVHIKTFELYLEPSREYARTERPVHLTSGPDWLSSTAGAELWFGDALRLKLFGRARVQVSPR